MRYLWMPFLGKTFEISVSSLFRSTLNCPSFLQSRNQRYHWTQLLSSIHRFHPTTRPRDTVHHVDRIILILWVTNGYYFTEVDFDVCSETQTRITTRMKRREQQIIYRNKRNDQFIQARDTMCVFSHKIADFSQVVLWDYVIYTGVAYQISKLLKLKC